jgi:HlyD family secretion protein
MAAMRRRLLPIAVLVIAAGVAAWWLARPPAAAFVTVQTAPLVRTLQFSGRVATRSRVDVGSTLTGRVAQVQAQEGQAVRAGQVLLRLDDAEWRAALAQAEAAVRQAQAALAGLRAGGRDTADAGVAQAEAQRAAAEAELRRTRELVARGFLSPAREDEAERAAAVARAQHAAAAAQRRALDASGSDTAQAEAQLSLARASAEAARARLSQAAVTAPADARVLLRQVEPGQIVQPGRALLTLALDGPTELLAQVDERFLEELAVGQTAVVRADAFPAQRFEAVLQRIASLVDAQRGSIELRFGVPQAPAFLREDMTLSLEVTTARRERTRVLPLAALRGAAPDAGTDADAAEVWIAADGRVRARAVRLGLRTLQAVEVLDGVADGEQVLVGASPPPGSRVRAVAGLPAAGAGGGGDTGGTGGTGGGEAGSAMTQRIGR